MKKHRKAPLRSNTSTNGVMAWQDDPLSKLPAISQPVPDLNKPPLRFKIKGPKLKPGIYPAGTPGFRYWTAAEALAAAVISGGSILGVKRWQPGSVLQVGLDEGVDFNAYYDRTELAFFHDTADGQIVYSGESPDIVCHEMGHACLDAHRPQLWDTPFIEAGAFHESFGDMSAILSALQLPSVRTAALSGVEQDKPSFLSRLAEQLGWAIRQEYPGAADPDCLRNACNNFTYADPQTLPDDAPANALCAEVHSFSRIFTGAFYEILSGMLATRSKNPTEADLAAVALDWAQLLLDATAAAPVQPNFFAQVASHIIDADTVRFHGKYRATLADVFVRRKMIPASAVQPLLESKGRLSKQARAFAAHITQPTRQVGMHKVLLSAKDFGLPKGDLVVQVPVEQKPALIVSSAVLRGEASTTREFERASHRFVSMLFAHDRVDTGKVRRTKRKVRAGAARSRQLPPIHSHALVKAPGGCGSCGGYSSAAASAGSGSTDLPRVCIMAADGPFQFSTRGQYGEEKRQRCRHNSRAGSDKASGRGRKPAGAKAPPSVASQLPQPTPEQIEAAKEKFEQGVLARGEAVPAGQPLPPGATHEIVTPAEGDPVLKRKRYSLR